MLDGNIVAGALGILLKASVPALAVIIVLSLKGHWPAAARSLLLRGAIAAILLIALLAPLAPSWRLPFGLALPPVSSSGHTVGLPGVSNGMNERPGAATGLSWLHYAWLVGVVVASARFGRGLIGLYRTIGKATVIPDNIIAGSLSCLDVDRHLRGKVQFLESHRTAVPFVAGIVSPIVILPSVWRAWPSERLKMVLEHECAHIRRRDVLWAYLANIAVALHWFNPLIWIVRRRLLREAERACDDWVLATGTPARDYATHLLMTVRDIRLTRDFSIVASALNNNCELKGRIMSILSDRHRVLSLGRSAKLLVAGVTVLSVVSLAGLSLQAGEPASDADMQAEQAKGDSPEPEEFVAVDVMPEMVQQTSPEYPTKLKEAGVEGWVYVQALVAKTGEVTDVRVRKSSGQELFEDAALKSAWGCKYKPATRGEHPVACWVTYRIEFVLDNDKSAG